MLKKFIVLERSQRLALRRDLSTPKDMQDRSWQTSGLQHNVPHCRLCACTTSIIASLWPAARAEESRKMCYCIGLSELAMSASIASEETITALLRTKGPPSSCPP